MKKIISLILILFILLMQVTIVNAATAEITFTTPTTLPENTKTFTAKIFLGNIQDLGDNQEDKVVSYSATLNYDTSVIGSVSVQGKNGWTVSYTNGAILANIDNVEQNKEIAELTFTLRDNINTDKINISLTGARISNDGTLKQDIADISKEIKIEVQQAEDPEQNETTNEVTNNVANEIAQNETNKNTVTTNNKTDTKTNQLNAVSANTTSTAKKVTVLPKAGQENIIIIAIVIIAIIGGFCIVRFKSIKTK